MVSKRKRNGELRVFGADCFFFSSFCAGISAVFLKPLGAFSTALCRDNIGTCNMVLLRLGQPKVFCAFLCRKIFVFTNFFFCFLFVFFCYCTLMRLCVIKLYIRKVCSFSHCSSIRCFTISVKQLMFIFLFSSLFVGKKCLLD